MCPNLGSEPGEGGTARGQGWHWVTETCPLQIPATMTAEELTFEILDRRKIVTKEKDYWSCFEVNEREEAGRCGGGDGVGWGGDGMGWGWDGDGDGMGMGTGPRCRLTSGRL